MLRYWIHGDVELLYNTRRVGSRSAGSARVRETLNGGVSGMSLLRG
jgi:hypothetical protein